MMCIHTCNTAQRHLSTPITQVLHRRRTPSRRLSTSFHTPLQETASVLVPSPRPLIFHRLMACIHPMSTYLKLTRRSPKFWITNQTYIEMGTATLTPVSHCGDLRTQMHIHLRGNGRILISSSHPFLHCIISLRCALEFIAHISTLYHLYSSRLGAYSFYCIVDLVVLRSKEIYRMQILDVHDL